MAKVEADVPMSIVLSVGHHTIDCEFCRERRERWVVVGTILGGTLRGSHARAMILAASVIEASVDWLAEDDGIKDRAGPTRDVDAQRGQVRLEFVAERDARRYRIRLAALAGRVGLPVHERTQ